MAETTRTAERPWLSPDYRGPNGTDTLATDEELATRSWEPVREALEQARNYWLATAGPDGRPHARPYGGSGGTTACTSASRPTRARGGTSTTTRG